MTNRTEVAVPCPACLLTPGLADTPMNQQGAGATGYHKRGHWKGLARSSMPLCRVCWGRKFVYPNRVCECGMPALVYSTKLEVWYCGFDSCANSANWRRNRPAQQDNWGGL